MIDFLGEVIIANNKTKKRRMIKLGFYNSIFYFDNGIVLSNSGKLVFHGTCRIGSNSMIATGFRGIINFGNNFGAAKSLKLCRFDSITLGKNTLIGWDMIIQDTDFHPLYNKETEQYSTPTIPYRYWEENLDRNKTYDYEGCINTK